MSTTMGDRIRMSREGKGLYQDQLAQLIGVKSSGVISNWEKDKNKPDAEKIVRLCQVLDVSPSYILDYHGEQAPATQQGPEDKRVSMEFSTRFLISTGFISEGEQLSDSDLAFLSGIFSLIDAWFSHKR